MNCGSWCLNVIHFFPAHFSGDRTVLHVNWLFFGSFDRWFCRFVSPGLFTLTGLLVYIQYCSQAMEDFKQSVHPEKLATVDVSFGWSLAIAWLSYSLEVSSGLLLMVAARITQVKRGYDSGMAML